MDEKKTTQGTKKGKKEIHKAKNRHNVEISNTILSLSIIFNFHQLVLCAKVYMKFAKPSEGYGDLCRTYFPLRLDIGFSDAR